MPLRIVDLRSLSDSELVDVDDEIGRFLVDAERLGAFELAVEFARTNSPPLMPIRRWMRHTDKSMPSSACAARHAMTCWHTLSISVPSRSKMNAGLPTKSALHKALPRL